MQWLKCEVWNVHSPTIMHVRYCDQGMLSYIYLGKKIATTETSVALQMYAQMHVHRSKILVMLCPGQPETSSFTFFMHTME